MERHPKKGRAREGGSYPRGPPATHPHSQALQPAVKTGMKPCAKLASVAAGGITRMDGGAFPPAIEAYQGKTDSDWQVSGRQEGNGMSSHNYSWAGS